MMIVGLAVTVFGASFPASSQSVLRARHTDLATDACQGQLEFWRYAGYSSLPAFPNGASTTVRTFTAPTELKRCTAQVVFTRVDTSFAAASTDTGMVRMDATLTWQGVGLDRGTVTLTSMLSQ